MDISRLRFKQVVKLLDLSRIVVIESKCQRSIP
jgi:hypothetical protein